MPDAEGMLDQESLDPADPLLSDGEALVLLLNGIAIGLFVLFVSGVITGSLPLRLLDPGWQLRVSETLIDYSAIPLMAFGLVHLAAFLDPLDEGLAARRDALRHWAVAVVFGFLLLIPLQPWAVWKGWSQASGSQAAELRRARRQIEQVREAIGAASSSADLQARLERLRAPGLPPGEASRPLPELRERLLQQLDRLNGRLERRLGSVQAQPLWEQILASARVVVASLGMALAWAAGAEWPNQDGTLLEHWLEGLRWGRRPPGFAPDLPGEQEVEPLPAPPLEEAPANAPAPGRPRGPRFGRRGAVDEDFFEQLAEAEAEAEREPPRPDS